MKEVYVFAQAGESHFRFSRMCVPASWLASSPEKRSVAMTFKRFFTVLC